MSQTFSASRSSSSADDSDHEYQGPSSRLLYSSQTSEVPTLTALASQASEASITSSVTSPEQRPSRLLDVNNILNPTPNRSFDNSARTPQPQFGSPRSITTTITRYGDARSLPPSPVELADSEAALRGGGYPRRIAQPVPPSNHLRGHHSRPSLSGIVGAQENPFPLGAPRRATLFGSESLSSTVPPQNLTPRPLPPPQAPQGPPSSGFPFPNVSAPLPYASSFHSTPLSSANVSPSTSYFTPVQPGQSPLSTTPYSHSNYSSFSGHGGAPPLGSPYGLPGSSTHMSQHGFPMMSLNTIHGAIHIPVDTTAASKVADEKRKRNAGASARFRQRRKEREREMSTRISDLETRLKKAEEERDYYREIVLRMQRPGRGPSQSQPPQLSPRTMGMGHSDAGFGFSGPGEPGRAGSVARRIGAVGENPGADLGGRGGHLSGSGLNTRDQDMENTSNILRREGERYERERHH